MEDIFVMLVLSRLDQSAVPDLETSWHVLELSNHDMPHDSDPEEPLVDQHVMTVARGVAVGLMMLNG